MCSMRCSLILLLERIPYVRYPEISISKLSFALEYVKHSISAAPTPLIVDVRLGLRQVSWYPSLHCFNTPNFIDSAKPTCVWITSSRRQCLSSLRLWKRLQLAILLRGITVQRVELCSTMNEARSFWLATVFMVKDHEDDVNNKHKGFNKGWGRQLMTATTVYPVVSPGCRTFDIYSICE